MSTGWDCHAHLFGPYERFPLAPERSYTPPQAPEPQYLSMLSRLGLSHGVLVHPSAYGHDHSLLFDALSRHANLRGVMVARPGMPPTLDGLRERGIRALRFSHRSGAGTNFAGSASFDDLLTLAPRMAAARLHAELWTDCRALPDIASRLRELPVPVVIDHMGGFDVARGTGDPGFRVLLSLLEERAAWVKLCVYRNLPDAADVEPGRPFHDAMVQAAADRLVWGSDWPHLRVTPAPDTAQLLDLLKRWTPDAATLEKILVANPQKLYG